MTFGHESLQAKNVAADVTGALTLGGYYECAVEATFGGGNVHFQKQLPNGTWTDIGSSTNFTSAGFATVGPLAPGQYRIHITTATAVFAAMTRCPVG